MADPPPWPSYPIGPPGAALAIGVASVNYARLEFAFGHMFATVTGVTNEEAWRLLPTLRNPERIRRIRKALRECDWPPDTKDRVNHFIDAFKILTDNRNLLDHSNVFELDEEPISLFKYNPEGKTLHIVVTVAELRQVADDMKTYHDYGSMLANSINLQNTAARSLLTLHRLRSRPCQRSWIMSSGHSRSEDREPRTEPNGHRSDRHSPTRQIVHASRPPSY